MKQQNRFSGLILKKPGQIEKWAEGFQRLGDDLFIKSEYSACFDGYIPGLASFNHDQVNEYEGVWSVCEIRSREFKLSRDRVGARSIYYFDNEMCFGFANEIKGLLSLPYLQFEASRKGTFDFLVTGRTSQMIAGVEELAPSHILTFNMHAKTYSTQKYYQYTRKTLDEDENSVAEALRITLERKIAEVSKDSHGLGSLLSGGIDSSVIAAALGENRGVPFITAMTSDEKSNETPYAEAVVRHLGIQEWHQALAENIDIEIENLHTAMELPTTSLGTFLQYEIMRFCKYHGITDVLDGTGADALYAGHNYYNAIYWNELVRQGKISKFVYEGSGFYLDDFWPKYYVKNMLKYYYLPRLSVASQLKSLRRTNPLLGALNPDLVDEQKGILSVVPPYRLKHLDEKLKYDFFDGPVTELLRFTDRLGKEFGVVNHSVFASYSEIFEHALNIPSDMKIKNGYTKYILRKAFDKKLPETVLARKMKMGLVAPNNLWMRQHKDLFLSYFDDSLSEFFHVERMRDKISNEIDESGEIENYKTFKFISFAIWHKVMQKWA